jgi:hypothetical protein
MAADKSNIAIAAIQALAKKKRSIATSTALNAKKAIAWRKALSKKSNCRKDSR